MTIKAEPRRNENKTFNLITLRQWNKSELRNGGGSIYWAARTQRNIIYDDSHYAFTTEKPTWATTVIRFLSNAKEN